MIIVYILLIIAAAVLVTAFVCYQMTFSVSKHANRDPHIMLPGKQYADKKDVILPLVDKALTFPYTDFYTTSPDGTKLHAFYYERQKGAPIEIQFHGYRSIALRDYCSGMQLAFNAGHNVLLVDQRAHGESEGRCLTFGINEREDCLAWSRFLVEKFGTDTKIILVGVSMGAATVLMAGELELPQNVVGILADSPYSSPKEIIKKVIKKDKKLPQSIFYPFVYLGAMIFGGFDLEKASASEAVKHCKIPVLLIHGDDDRFVPYQMSEEIYRNCASEKKLLIVKNAGHGLGYLEDSKAYLDAMDWLFTTAKVK